MLAVALLGPVQAHLDGELVALPAGRTSELLARLAVEPGVPVRADVLLEDLWAAPTGANTLQSKVSALRRALGDRSLVVGGPGGYRLVVPPEAVDAECAVRLGTASAQARTRGDAGTSLERAREGLALFRGPVLVDAGDWAAPHRAHLEEVRAALAEDAAAARVDLGAGGEVVAELETLVLAHPLREGLWAALITALYRAGRQADALAAYARLRRSLVDELGIEPSAPLRSLEEQVLRQVAELGVSPRRRAESSGRVPGNLPAASSPLVGRERDAAAVAAALAEHRLVTVVGPGGVGKTRLALEVAHRTRCPGGVWLVRLESVGPGSVLVQVVAEALHLAGGEQALRDRLGGAPAVLLLDTCEHLVTQVAATVRALLDAVPGLRVLATSQAPLGLDDEHRHQLAPITLEQSATLFVRRAREVQPQLSLEAGSQVVRDICRSLEGLPLAVELTAARTRALSVGDIARRLGDRFALVRDPSSHRPERWRALEGAIAWSYDLLLPEDQHGLWALSCFAGGASLDALEQVMTALGVPAASTLDVVSRLVDRSLVTAEPVEGSVRYRLLDSIRAYAGDRLLSSGARSLASAAHAAWYGDTAAWCDEHVRSGHEAACTATARAERLDVDAALAWCAENDPPLGARIAIGLGWTWVVLGEGTAGAARVRSTLTAALPDRQRACGQLLAAWLEASAGDVVRAQVDLDRAQALAGAVGEEVLLADCQRVAAFVAIQQGRPDLVLACADASLSTYTARALPWCTAASLLLQAHGRLMVGDTAGAAGDATEAVELLEVAADAWGMLHARAVLAGVAQAEHRWDDAAAELAQVAREAADRGFAGQAALHRATLARVQHRAGDPQAAASSRQAVSESLACGDGRLAATARLNLARLCREVGNQQEAVALLVENLRWYDDAGGGDFALLTRCVLAAARDDAEDLEAVLAEATASGTTAVEVCALDALARLSAEAGEVPAARTLLARADQLAPAVSHLVDDRDRLDATAARRLLG